jgi:hypothetical protein
MEHVPFFFVDDSFFFGGVDNRLKFLFGADSGAAEKEPSQQAGFVRYLFTGTVCVQKFILLGGLWYERGLRLSAETEVK